MLPKSMPYKTSQGFDSMHGTTTQEEEGANPVTYIQRLTCRCAQCIWHCSTL